MPRNPATSPNDGEPAPAASAGGRRPGELAGSWSATARDDIERLGWVRLLGPWLLIVGAGVAARLAGMPVAWLVGPMLATVMLTLLGAAPEPSTARLFPVVQAVIGATFSASFTAAALKPLGHNWLPIAMAILAVFVLSLVAGLVLTRVAALDVATASLGTIPGGASGMVAMSEELGGDVRLVAFMQYARLVIVILSVSVLASVVDPAVIERAQEVAGSDASRLEQYGLAVLVSALGGWLGARSGIPAGTLVGPMLVGLIPGLIGIGPLAWPGWVLALAYLLLGARVGSRFDRSILRRLWALLPFVLAFIVMLTMICAGVGWMLHRATGLDLLTSLLATSPGGMDAAVIAALDTGANVTMVASIQMTRLFLMVLLGPFIIKRLVAWSRQRIPVPVGPDERV